MNDAAESTSLQQSQDPLDDDLIDLLVALMESLREHFVTALETVDLPPAQGQLLMCLNQPTSMSEIARNVGFDASHVTSIVDRLEERLLVERRPDDHDRRVKRIAITETGIEVRKQIKKELFRNLTPLGQLTGPQRSQLHELLATATGITGSHAQR